MNAFETYMQKFDNFHIVRATTYYELTTEELKELWQAAQEQESGCESVATGGRLTEEELHSVWDFAEEKPGVAINPKYLTSMVEEIRTRRNQKSVGKRLMELDKDALYDLVEVVGLAMSDIDPEDFSECLETISEMIFPELVGDIIFAKRNA